MMNRLVAVLATATLAMPLGTAIANPFAQAASGVAYTDLDLASADGQARLAIRLDRAAADVCGRGFDRVHPTLSQQAAQCRAEVAAETRARIDRRLAAHDGTVRPAGSAATAAMLE